MTDSYYSEDRSIDHSPDIEDWSIKGEKEDRERIEAATQRGIDDEAADLARQDADYKEYKGRVEGVKEEIKELNDLKEKLLPLLQEIKEKEQFLIEESYDWIWEEDDDPYEEPYYLCESKEDKMMVDLARNYDYEVITPWINQYTPILEEIEKQKELREIQRRKEENLKQHKKKFGVEAEDTWAAHQRKLDNGEIPF